MSGPTDGFSSWTGDDQGIDLTYVGPDGVTNVPIRGDGERPEADQGLLLADGSLYGPGTRRAALAAASVLPDDVDWSVEDYRELTSRARRHAGPLLEESDGA